MPTGRVPDLHRIPQVLRLDNLPPVMDQEGILACAVNACANALTYCMARSGVPDYRASRMFVYYNTRRYVMRLADMAADTGSNLRDACKAVSKFGACEESVWPYARRLLHARPPAHLYHAARRVPMCKYRSVPHTLPHMVSCLLHGHPILLGMSMFSNIAEVQADGVLGMPRAQDTLLGGHGVLVCGYNMTTRRFLVQNCWGASWGNKGFFEVPFEYMLDKSKAWDLWVLQMPQDA